MSWGSWKASGCGLVAWGTNHVIRGFECSAPSHPYTSREWGGTGGRLHTPTASDPINRSCVMKPAWESLGFKRLCRVVSPWRHWRESTPTAETEAPSPFLHTLPCIISLWVFHLFSLKYPLIVNWEDPLEEEIVIHSIILAWEIPQTEELGGQQSEGSQTDRHDWTHTHR